MGVVVLLYFCLPVEVFAHGISEADRERMLSGGYLRYVWLGATHMLTGYDHLLFLLGVVFRQVAGFIASAAQTPNGWAG